MEITSVATTTNVPQVTNLFVIKNGVLQQATIDDVLANSAVNQSLAQLNSNLNGLPFHSQITASDNARIVNIEAFRVGKIAYVYARLTTLVAIKANSTVLALTSLTKPHYDGNAGNLLCSTGSNYYSGSTSINANGTIYLISPVDLPLNSTVYVNLSYIIWS